jgi:protein-S-isoprenylcysteine O-methyltransferase Ste14
MTRRAAGALILLSSFARFVVEGVGTPAPVAPTERLVVGGFYRHVRNPMYVAVVATIIGQALALGQPGLLWYGGIVAAAMVAFVHVVALFEFALGVWLVVKGFDQKAVADLEK